MKATKTVCPYCGVGCGLELLVEDGEVVNVERWDDHPVNEGQLCVKGVTSHGFLNHQDRLEKPMLKVQGRFVDVSWSFAYRAVAEELERVREEHGPEAVGFLASAKCSNEENYLIQKLARSFGTGNVDQCARLCHSPSMAAMGDMLGSAAMSNGFDDLEESDVHLIAGANPMEQHPIFARRLRKTDSTKVLVDPRRTRTAKMCDLHLRPRPGSDAALFNSIGYVLTREMGVHGEPEVRGFLEGRTEGFEDYLEGLEGYSPEAVEDITGIEPGKVREAAEVYGEADRAAILTGLGVTQHLNGTDNVRSIVNVALASGNFGEPGTGVNPLRGQDNVQGACDVGALPDHLPGYDSLDPEDEGLTEVEMLEAAEAGELKALYVTGENPAVSEPDGVDVEKALENLDLLVVQDLFPTQTARFADALLPAASFAEKRGTATSAERRVQLREPAADSPGEARPDWEILLGVARELGLEGFDFDGTEEIYEETAGAVGFYPPSYGDLGEHGAQWPHDAENSFMFDEEFRTDDGRAVFRPVGYRGGEDGLLLTTGRVMEHYNTGEVSRRVDLLFDLVREPFVEVSPADAGERGIDEGDEVVLRGRDGAEGESVAMEVRVTDNVPEGTVFAPFHFVEALINRVIDGEVDPDSGIPSFKRTRVEIEVEE